MAQHTLVWVGSMVVVVSLCGCTPLPSWDDLTSRELGVKALWTPPPPPLTVIEKSTDGYARAKALNKLDESSSKGDLEKNLQILQSSAVNDRDPLCRIAALRTLGRYKEPRAGKILMDVYLSNPGMSAENNAFIRQQALTSLQAQSPAEAKKLFIDAARQPGGSLTGAAQRDRMEVLDERLTAIRALGKYPQPDAVETLVKLLETEKDTAIRKCAHESLKESTQKDIAEDGKAWREYVATGKVTARQTPSMLAGFMKTTPAAPASTGPGVFDTISNWVRPEKQPEPAAAEKRSSAPPSTLPATLPSTLPVTPLAPTTTPAAPPNPNQVRRTPANNREVLPAGARRNEQGEVIVPVTP